MRGWSEGCIQGIDVGLSRANRRYRRAALNSGAKDVLEVKSKSANRWLRFVSQTVHREGSLCIIIKVTTLIKLTLWPSGLRRRPATTLSY